MLDLVGTGKALTCNGQTRRDFLRVGTLGAVGLSLPQYLYARQHGGIKPTHDKRSCILIFNLGAPSQLDTFDLKPHAPVEVRGPFKPISTRSSEIEISEINDIERILQEYKPKKIPCIKVDGSYVFAHNGKTVDYLKSLLQATKMEETPK